MLPVGHTASYRVLSPLHAWLQFPNGRPVAHRSPHHCAQAVSGGELVLGDLRMPGLDLATVACSAAQSGAAGVPTATAVLCVSVDGMPPQELRVRVRPGAPARVILQPDHPWAEVMRSLSTCSAATGPITMSCRARRHPHSQSVNPLTATIQPSTMHTSRKSLHKPSCNCEPLLLAAHQYQEVQTMLCLLTGDHCQRGKPV